MLYRARLIFRKLRTFYAKGRHQGYGPLQVFAKRLPSALLAKAYRRFTVWVNGRLVNPLINRGRLKAFHAGSGKGLKDPFYLIVMPDTLHFLNPCMRLVVGQATIVLLHNGARDWERAFLEERYPGLPAVALATVPGSSVNHGDVLNLLLETSPGNFGVLDHDAYVFNPEIFADLSFAEGELMLSYFYGYSTKAQIFFPYTHFLYFNRALMLDVMRRNRIDCNHYKRPRQEILEKLKAGGVEVEVALKDYHWFFDTLHLLYAVGYAEGLRVGFLDIDDDYAILHVGRTSTSTHTTKALTQVYIDLRFLELPCNRDLIEPYRAKITKCESSQKLRVTLPPTKEVQEILKDVDTIVDRLESHGALVE
ncbi:MAG: hypothetical protein AAF495_19290 [Pseudomonadota bacterium]